MYRRLSLCFVFLFILALVPFGAFPSSYSSHSYKESYFIASNGYTVASNGSAGPDSSQGNYTLTWDDSMTNYDGIKDTAGEAYVILNFTVAPIENFIGFNYSVEFGAYNDDDGPSELWVYDWANNDWVYLGDGGQGISAWANGSISGAQYSDGSQITIMANSTDSDGAAGVAVMIAWLEILENEWLSGWYYRKQIQLNGSDGAGFNYVLKWRVEQGYGTDNGQVVYTNGNCQDKFGDIRWTEEDGETELNYYLDEYTSADDATFYVQISANLTSDQIIYIYYGTETTTATTSNGPNTFYEWLDSTNTTGWTKSNIQVSNYGGYLRFYNPSSPLYGYALRNDLSYPEDQWRMLIRMKTISLGGHDSTQISNMDGNTNHRFTEFLALRYTDQNSYYYWNGSQTWGSSWGEDYQEYVIQMTVDEDDSSAGVDYHIWRYNMERHNDHFSNEFRYGSPTVADGIHITDTASSTYLDARMKYFAIMPNLDTEPFVGTYGSEEERGEGTPSPEGTVRCKLYDETLSTYIDETADANDAGSSDVPLLEDSVGGTPEVNDSVYFGSSAAFTGLIFDISTQGVGSWAIAWEYYNGASWASLPDLVDGTNGFNDNYGDGLYTLWTTPADWERIAVDEDNYYWVRARVSSFTTVPFNPKMDQVYRLLYYPLAPIQGWGLNTAFVILGLVMIPASSLYLVRGGKDAMNTDKLFYVLVIFFVGWALLVGGIMP